MSATSLPSPVVWDADGQPRSILFDDVYHSRAGGLGQARQVFLAGCGLPDAWGGRSTFTVGELGFGAGLNVAALLDLWRQTRPPDARLHIFSVEGHPMRAAEAARALAPWPEIGDIADRLVAAWPRRAHGFHRIGLPDLLATIDLALMDVSEALANWRGQADAWFLDGFAPDRNPAIWSQAVLGAVAARSAPGAAAATYTVAGVVRRGLQTAGFAVARKPGFAGKRERLEARRPGTPTRPTRLRVAIVGAGIAGASLARAFVALGVRPLVVERASAGAGASGNVAALVTPRLDAGHGPVGALYAQALNRAADLYDATPHAVIAAGAVQMEADEQDVGRFDKVAAGPLFAPEAVARLSPTDVSARLGEPVARGGLWFEDGRVVSPAAVLDAWLAEVEWRTADVATLEPDADCWRLLAAGGLEIARADVVCLAGGLDTVRLTSGLPLTALRGQASFTAGATVAAPVMGAAFAIPAPGGVLFGATHDRGDAGDELRPGDDARNLEQLATTLPQLAAGIDPAALSGRAAVRAVTPDFLPLAGPLAAPGLAILSGLGSRGYCAGPLLAEHVAALAIGAPSPLPAPLAEIVHPGRFDLRRERRLARSGRVQT